MSAGMGVFERAISVAARAMNTEHHNLAQGEGAESYQRERMSVERTFKGRGFQFEVAVKMST